MIIITYSATTADTLKADLGGAHYSYYFIYVKYLPVLQQIGKVIAVSDPVNEVDKIFHENPEDECIFLSFTPPNDTPSELECPTVCVFAWEFSTIPNEAWNDIEQNDWAGALTRIKNAATLSHYAKEVADTATDSALNIAAIPAAVPTIPVSDIPPRRNGSHLQVEAAIYDSANYNLTPDMVNNVEFSTRDPMKMQLWDDTPAQVLFAAEHEENGELLVGFYAPEDWGAWTKTDDPWVLLPYRTSGPLTVTVELIAYGNNAGRDILFTLGSQSTSIQPVADMRRYDLHFNLPEDSDVLKISNLDIAPLEESGETRTLGLGIKSLQMSRPAPEANSEKAAFRRLSANIASLFGGDRTSADLTSTLPGNRLELSGVIYTSVFNPQDGRKNWEDMITAFCWAFRDQPDATLVLKMTHTNHRTFLGRLLASFAKMAPFKCRVIAVHGFLTDEQYQALIESTHYVVNTSIAEGQCLPLMEFMGQGIPAIAPDHTAMADYIDKDNAFIIESSIYPTDWPQDERKAISTMAYQLNWDSIRQAFLDSFQIAGRPYEYHEMQQASIKAIENSAGQHKVYIDLKTYLGSVAQGSDSS